MFLINNKGFILIYRVKYIPIFFFYFYLCLGLGLKILLEVLNWSKLGEKIKLKNKG